ncbi:transglutaminase-like domain-containing protein [Mariniblastus fucicola]|nr:transglutaminase domain-containing protein [Mariniblastus fucicola]
MKRTSAATNLAIVVACIVVAPSLASGQEPERVPSGDLSDFFNPPGIKTEGLNSTTRLISPDKKKADPKEEDKDTGAMDANGAATEPSSTSPPADASDANPSASEEPETEPQPPEAASNTSGADRVKIEDEELGEIEGGISFGPPSVTNWRVGVVMATGANPVRNATCRIPIPIQWPEQTVSVYEENLPGEIKSVTWEDLGNIRLMTLQMVNVPPGTNVIATVTFTVSTSQIIAPKNTSIFRIPSKRSREIKAYYGESPEISMRNTKLKKQAKTLFQTTASDWAKVEGLYDWVRDNIEERSGDAKGSIETFLDKSGTGEDRVGLFIAMCRINKVPARMVFVDGSQYAEFYLVDNKEVGHWFPCKVSGIREFGSIGEPRVILQKGDNYRVPGEKKKLKFVPAKATIKGSRPRVIRFAREPLSVK